MGRYKDTGYHDPHHHPMSRGQNYAVTRRQDYYDPYEDSQPSYNDHHVITRHQMGADRQLATLGVTPGLGHSVFGITANSAIGLLGLLLFINILSDVISQITGGGRRRRLRRDLSRNS